MPDPADGAFPPRPDLFYTRRLALTGRRGVVASTVSCAVVIGALAAILFAAPGSAAVRQFFFSPHDAWRAFVGDPAQGLSSVGQGLITNVWMFLVSEALILVFALAIAATRVSRSPVLLPFRVLATVYTDVFRGVPVLLVIFMVGFGLPALSLHFVSTQSPSVYGVVALTITYTAYVAEVFRAGIFSVPHGQLLAARSLGLTYPTTMRRVVLPQAVRTVIPPLLNDFISLQKDTALVSVLGVVETTRAAQIYGSTEFNYTGYVVAALLFLALTIPMTRFTDRLIARDRARRLAGAT
ncbi:MAG TPA: amino acid ABC transporter permease [Acidimicrobiales bacterium]|nr:amino acid ABC transporter permease [Acidimicrobiales bacterium]